MHLNFISRITLIFLFSVFAQSAFAQHAGMAALRAQENRDFSNRIDRQMQDALLRPSSGEINYNHEYTFDVTMVDGTKKQIKSKMHFDTVSKKIYLVAEDKSFKRSDKENRYQKIYPSQTTNISRTDSSYLYEHHFLYGMAQDTCWAFRVVSGPISVFSYFSERYGSGPFTTDSIVGIQLNDGPIVKMTKENLLQIVGDNPDITKFIEKDNLFKAIRRYNAQTDKNSKKSSDDN